MRLWQRIKTAAWPARGTAPGDGVAPTAPGPATASDTTPPATTPPAATPPSTTPPATTPQSATPPSTSPASTSLAPALPPALPPDAAPATPGEPQPAPIWAHPLVRAGALAWALIGLVVVLAGAATVLGELSLIVVPLILALFPAALLSPLMRVLVTRRVPPAIAALLVIFGSLGLLVGVGSLLAPTIAEEGEDLIESMREGIVQLEEFLDDGPFGLDPVVIAGWLETGQERLVEIGRQAAGTLAAAVAEGVAGVLFGLVALFFYLKDGARIAEWLKRLFPAYLRTDADEIGTRAWVTIGAYFRGQLLVALVDAVFIGLGLWLLGVPLALPLAVLVFFGGLFPIVGAFISGAVAVLVALAAQGLGTALAVLALVVAVQQIESNILAPVVLGKATALHPLAVILALAAGGILLGVLGAFLAVPVAASLARAIGHLRTSRQARGDALSPAAPASAGGP